MKTKFSDGYRTTATSFVLFVPLSPSTKGGLGSRDSPSTSRAFLVDRVKSLTGFVTCCTPLLGVTSSSNTFVRMEQRTNSDMSSLSRPRAHGSRRQRSALKQTVCIAVSLLLGLAFAFQGAVALDRALSAPNMAPGAYPVPTAAVGQSRQAVNTTFADCVAAINSSNSNQDSLLSQNEYMTFVNKLSDDAFQGQGLANVSKPIKKNYFTLANNTNGIDVTGSKPGDSPSDAETANLQNICESTTAAINAALAPTAAPSQAPAPADGATASPEAQCFEAMNTADTNEDSMLNQNEYFMFVNISSDGAFSNLSFPELPKPFRQNFFRWRNNETNQINIFGSKSGQDASTEQMDFLMMMCNETDALLSPTPAPADGPTVSPSSAAPVDEPTSSPSVAAPSAAPGVEPTSSPSAPGMPTAAPAPPTPTTGTNVTIQSEFIIYNTVGLDGNATMNSSAFEDLTLAYSNLAQETVAALAAGRRTRLLRITSGQRRLTVDFIENSARIASLTDTQCPPGTPSDALCQTALASYRVSVVDEDDTVVSERYTNATQTAIDDGALQTQLNEVNPNSIITIAEPTAPPTMLPMGPPTSSPSAMPPTGPPTSSPSASDGLSTGAIAGIVVSGAVVMLGAGVALFYSQKSHIHGKKPVGDSSIDGGGKYDEDAEKEKRPSKFGDDVADGTKTTASATADDFNKYADDDYSYQSGSFYDNESSGSTLQTATTSKLEDYKFDEPIEEKVDVAPMTSKALASDYNSSSNAGSSGWSTSEEDTDNEADDHEARPENESSGDSFFNSPKTGAIERKEEPPVGSISTSGSESTSGSSGSESSGSESTSGSASTSESEAIEPQSNDSGTGTYSHSYDESEFSELSPYSPQKAPVSQGAAVTRMANAAAEPASDDKPNTAAIAGGVTAGVVGAAAIGALAYAATRKDDSSDSASYTSSDSTYDESKEDASRGSIPSAEGGPTKSSVAGKSLASGPGKSLATEDLSGSARERVSELDDFVKKGDWDGVIASAKKFEAETDTPKSLSSSPRGSASRSSSSGSSMEGSSHSEDSASESRRSKEYETSGETGLETSGETGLETSGETGLETSGETGTSSWPSGTSTTDSETPEEAERRAEYRAEVEALVRVVVPEEINNVDVMMVQFRGREAELVSTLRNMQERSVAQRARAAVHKSGNQPPRRDTVPGQYRRDGNYSTDSRMSQNTEDTHGSAAGSAAIAAASVPRPAAGGRVPIHPPPVPAHESTTLESLGSTESGTQDLGRSTSTDGSDQVPGAQRTSDEHTSTSRSGSYDSRSASSGSSRSSSSTSSSGSESKSGSSSSSGSGSHEKDYGTSHGTGTNFDSSRDTSYETSQSTSLGHSLPGESTGSSEVDRNTASRWAERRGSTPTKLKPWLRGGEQDDDVSEDFETMGVSVGQFSRKR